VKRFHAVLFCVCLAALFSPAVSAHQIALKNGRVIQFQDYRVTAQALLYTDSSGHSVKVALSDIDLDRTRELSAGDNPPLDLPGLTISKQPQTNTSSLSLGDVARKNRTNDAQATGKRIWTSDDFSLAEERATTASTETDQADATATLQKFRLLGKEELGAAVLKMSNVPDVDFPTRKDWEERLFAAKRAWLDQLDRMESHKDSSQDARDTETRLAQGARLNFERISQEGIQQARAVNDPALKAHLEYQRQLDFCKQTTGNALQSCLASVDKLKWQMEREGTW
jgi:hypothetical protein